MNTYTPGVGIDNHIIFTDRGQGPSLKNQPPWKKLIFIGIIYVVSI